MLTAVCSTKRRTACTVLLFVAFTAYHNVPDTANAAIIAASWCKNAPGTSDASVFHVIHAIILHSASAAKTYPISLLNTEVIELRAIPAVASNDAGTDTRFDIGALTERVEKKNAPTGTVSRLTARLKAVEARIHCTSVYYYGTTNATKKLTCL